MRRSEIVIVALVAFGAATSSARLRAQDAAPPLVREAKVPLHDGALRLDELVQALLEAHEVDANGLRVPALSLDLGGVPGRIALAATRRALRGIAQLRVAPHADELVVTIDRARVREARRDVRAKLAKWVASLTGEDLLARSYELRLPDALDPKLPLAVLVHGVEGAPTVWDDLRAFLAQDPRAPQVATFRYPNDESAERVARALADQLRALHPQPIAIVAHSFGGLIARAVVEDPALDPGNVTKLILIGTPSGGSHVAGLRFVLETTRVIAGREDGERLLDAWRETFADGLGEAGGDLQPGSVFLTRLAQRERNPRVDYHLVLGTRSALDARQVQSLKDRIRAPFARSLAERILGDLDELVDGRGDGAVSVTSGKLAGVEPVLVPLDHLGLVRRRGLLGRTAPDEAHAVFPMIAAWLAAAK